MGFLSAHLGSGFPHFHIYPSDQDICDTVKVALRRRNSIMSLVMVPEREIGDRDAVQ